MKAYKLIILVLSLFIAVDVNAKKMNGIIYFENDSAEVEFDVPYLLLSDNIDMESLQLKVSYKDAAGKKNTASPENTKGFKIFDGDKVIEMMSFKNTLDLGKTFKRPDFIFLEVVRKGSVYLMLYYYHDGVLAGPSMQSQTIRTTNCIVKKQKGPLTRFGAFTYNKDLRKFYSDCPSLIAKYNNGDFNGTDPYNIELNTKVADYYNENCK